MVYNTKRETLHCIRFVTYKMYENIFTHHEINLWTSFPSRIVSSSSVLSFKAKFDSYRINEEIGPIPQLQT